MIAIDVHYGENGATAAGVSFSSWAASVPDKCYLTFCEAAQPYEAGSFYLRELPCIEKLSQLVTEKLDCIVIDGYVTLGMGQRPGLGLHLWNSLGKKVPIIGVAKTRFLDTPDEAVLLRGHSTRPLYISAAGISLEEAKEDILHMHGPNRMPTLLKVVDNLARGLIKMPDKPAA